MHADGNTYKALVENNAKELTEVALDEKSLARIIEDILATSSNPNQPIRLLSCSSLESAQQLSKYLDRPVIATDAIVRVHPDGGITTIARSGNNTQKWYKLKGGNKVEVSKPKEPVGEANKRVFVSMGKVNLDPKIEAKITNFNQIEKDAFLLDYPHIKSVVEGNPGLVDGWKVLEGDEALRVLENTLDYIQKNPNKIDDILPEGSIVSSTSMGLTFEDKVTKEWIGLAEIKDGDLELGIYREGLKTILRGKQAFNSLVHQLKLRGIKYNGMRGLWNLKSSTLGLILCIMKFQSWFLT